MQLKVSALFASLAALSLLAMPSFGYTSYKTVSFGPSQTGQAVTYAVKDNTNTAVTAGVSGAVVELGGGAYGAAITVPDGANYFVVWSETNGGTTYTASDRIEAPATAAVATAANQSALLSGQATISTQTSSTARQADMTTALTAQGYTGARAAKIDGIGSDTPGVTLLLGRPAQTGDAYGLVSPLIASGKFTVPALSNAPASTGGGGVTDASVTADVTAALNTFGPALVTQILHGMVDGTVTLKQALAINLAYNAAPYTRTKTATTQTLVFSNQAGLPLITSVTALDASGNPTGRTSVTFSNLPN